MVSKVNNKSENNTYNVIRRSNWIRGRVGIVKA